MPKTTYTIPVDDPYYVADCMSALFSHLPVWKTLYDVDFNSCVRSGSNLMLTFDDEIPQDEINHIFSQGPPAAAKG